MNFNIVCLEDKKKLSLKLRQNPKITKCSPSTIFVEANTRRFHITLPSEKSLLNVSINASTLSRLPSHFDCDPPTPPRFHIT